jgi:hypothetical protein
MAILSWLSLSLDQLNNAALESDNSPTDYSRNLGTACELVLEPFDPSVLKSGKGCGHRTVHRFVYED